jgi:hypothetical protein
MSVGRLLIGVGAGLLAVSVGVFTSVAARAPVAVATPMHCDMLSIGWTIACLPYPHERAPATSYPQAFGCRNE